MVTSQEKYIVIIPDSIKAYDSIIRAKELDAPDIGSPQGVSVQTAITRLNEKYSVYILHPKDCLLPGKEGKFFFKYGKKVGEVNAPTYAIFTLNLAEGWLNKKHFDKYDPKIRALAAYSGSPAHHIPPESALTVVGGNAPEACTLALGVCAQRLIGSTSNL